MLGKNLQLKTTALLVVFFKVSLLFEVSKVFQKLGNNRTADHVKKCDLFSDFQYGFRSSWSTVDLLIVLSDRIARAFNSSGANWALAPDISKAFDKIWHAGLLHKSKLYGISGQKFGLISSFPSNRGIRVVLDGKMEYPGNVGVPQVPILDPTLFLLYINHIPDNVICDVAIYVGDTTLFLVWSGIWSVATIWIGFWTWIWTMRHCGLR